jgi:hypothetical protein
MGLAMSLSMNAALAAASSPFGLLDERIRAIGSLASLALALVVLFTNIRYQRLTADLKVGVGKFDKKAALALLLDAVVVLATVAACTAMGSLFGDSISVARWLKPAHALQSVFCVIYISFIGLAVFQLWIFGSRLWVHLK